MGKAGSGPPGVAENVSGYHCKHSGALKITGRKSRMYSSDFPKEEVVYEIQH